MIITRKRLEEIVAGRLQERDQQLELLKRIEWNDDSLSRRMDRSMHTHIPASGVWRATACIWTSLTARAPA